MTTTSRARSDQFTTDCPPACATLTKGLRNVDTGGWSYSPCHASGCVHYSTPWPETAWCPECRRTQGVVEVSTEGWLTRAGETEAQVTRLECGHDLIGQEKVVVAAPGQPWAGENVAAATVRDALSWGRLARQLALADPFRGEDGPSF